MNVLLQGFALEILHGDERALFVLAYLVHGANIGMIERRSSARFAFESFESLRIADNSSGRNFRATRLRSFVSSAS